MTALPMSAAKAVASALNDAHRVLIVSHVDPDGDAVGSSLGLSHALDALGVENDVVLGSGGVCPPTYRWLPGSERFIAVETLALSDVRPDMVVLVDSPSFSRLGNVEEIARRAARAVIIDHHPGDGSDAELSLIDPSASAAGVLIWELLPILGVAPDEKIATCLYTALLTDTGRFGYSNATARAFRTAAEMVEAGVCPSDISVAVYETRSPGAQALIARTLSRLTIANNGLVAYSWTLAADFTETGAVRAEAENLIDVVRPLAGIEIALLAKCNEKTVRMSLRSKSGFDVSAVARVFGGGGHKAAAGFTYEGGLERLLDVLLPMLPGGCS